MGIKGLTKLIQQHADNAYRESPIKAYFGRTVAMDATMALYQFLIAVRFGSGDILRNDEGEATSHVIGFFYRTIRMLENGIKPIYIFDGKPPDFKSHELAKRKLKRQQAQAELKEAEEAGNMERVVQMQKRTVKVGQQHVREVQVLLTYMGVPWYAAPGEAEAQAARMCAQGIVYGAGTEDMDALTFGTLKLVRHLTDSEARKKPVLEFDLKKVLSGMELSMDQFIDICILCGCDYCPSIRGIGPVRAYEFIKKWKSIEGILKNIGSETRYVIPENWQYAKARELFKCPEVTDAKDLPKFSWDLPKEKELTEYLVDKMSFEINRVLKGIERLKKCKGKSAQKRLDCFFKVMPSSNSKRKNKNKDKNKNKKKNNRLSGKKRKRMDGNGNSDNIPPKLKKQRTKQ